MNRYTQKSSSYSQFSHRPRPSDSRDASYSQEPSLAGCQRSEPPPGKNRIRTLCGELAATPTLLA